MDKRETATTTYALLYWYVSDFNTSPASCIYSRIVQCWSSDSLLRHFGPRATSEVVSAKMLRMTPWSATRSSDATATRDIWVAFIHLTTRFHLWPTFRWQISCSVVLNMVIGERILSSQMKQASLEEMKQFTNRAPLSLRYIIIEEQAKDHFKTAPRLVSNFQDLNPPHIVLGTLILHIGFPTSI